MKILAIETSCDDTGIAILEVLEKTKNFNVLANVVASQIEVHQKYGGVYPAMAKREHQKNLVPTLIEALEEADLLKTSLSVNFVAAKNTDINTILQRESELLKKITPFLQKYKKPDIDLISVTNGPGLEPCLWVGVNFAKALSLFWNIPIVPVNHIESHVLVNLLDLPAQAGNQKIKFPTIALVVSGGHTQIILVTGIGKYKILGETRDDAAGECFDKCAKILGLGYPGGPIISKLASQAVIPSLTGNPVIKTLDSRFRGNDIHLPRPMINTKDYDFSFSGLKTAVLYAWQKRKQNSESFATKRKTHQLQTEFSAEIQQAIIDVLIKKTIKAVKDYKAKTLILGGGVSANQELRKQFIKKLEKESPNTKFLVPKPALSTDNAVMTAITGFYHRKQTKAWQKIQADGNLRIR